MKNVYINEESLNQQISKFKDVFVSDHRDLINITTELNKYTKNTNNNIQLLKDNFIKFTNEENTNNLIEKTNHENTIQGMQEIIYNLMKIILKFTNYERDTSTHLHCKLQKIPPRIIESETLYNDLINSGAATCVNRPPFTNTAVDITITTNTLLRNKLTKTPKKVFFKANDD